MLTATSLRPFGPYSDTAAPDSAALLARAALRRPDVEQDDLAFVVGHRLVLIRAEHLRAEIRRLRADRHREELVLHEVRRRAASPMASTPTIDADDGPLLARGHTVTPQSPRSAPISARGSVAEKIALPATNVSAPAFQTS